jgi:aspartyl aminopeptidase
MRERELVTTTDLMAFIEAAPSPFHAAVEAARRLSDAGFVGIDERDSWHELPALGFCVRGGAICAWAIPDGVEPVDGARIVAAHTDSPNLRLKPIAETGGFGWKQLGVEIYGGILANSWLDRDLGLSGRVALRSGEIRLVRIERPLARVAQLAIHLDREVNERGVQLDKQAHLAPIWGLGDVRPGELAELLAEPLGIAPGDVLAADLMFHDLTAPALLGRDRELLASARLDNLVSCHSAIASLIASASSADHVAVAALFDHEEVGSQTATGAHGQFLTNALRRIVIAQDGGDDEFVRFCGASVCLSADMAHAVHPNYPERHEPNHRPLPNGGPVLKVNAGARYATDAMSAAVFIEACERAEVPWQRFVSRNNVPCGSTIGPITASALGIATVDAGCAQLSMHSARELMGAYDPGYFVAATTEFLQG